IEITPGDGMIEGAAKGRVEPGGAGDVHEPERRRGWLVVLLFLSESDGTECETAYDGATYEEAHGLSSILGLLAGFPRHELNAHVERRPIRRAAFFAAELQVNAIHPRLGDVKPVIQVDTEIRERLARCGEL